MPALGLHEKACKVCALQAFFYGSSQSATLDPVRWAEFQVRYAAEVRQHAEQFDQVRALARKGPVTLVYAARDEVHNEAVVLRNLLLGRKPRPDADAG